MRAPWTPNLPSASPPPRLLLAGALALAGTLAGCGYDVGPPRINNVEALTSSGQRITAPLGNGIETSFDGRHIPASAPILLTFSEQVDPQSVQEHIWIFNDNDKTRAPIDYMLVADQLYLRPRGGTLTAQKNYYVNIEPGVKDTSGNSSSQQYHVNFYADLP